MKLKKLVNLSADLGTKDSLYNTAKKANVDCMVNAAYRTLKKPPWEEDGHKFIYQKAYNWNGGSYSYLDYWDNLKGNRAQRIDLHQVVADFYLFDGIASQAFFNGPGLYIPQFDGNMVKALVEEGHEPIHRDDDHQLLSLWAMMMQARLIELITPVFQDYMHYAISTELQFHRFFKQYCQGGEDSGDCSGAWRAVYEYYGGINCADWAGRIFRDGKNPKKNKQSGWGSGFGGEAWAIGCDVLKWFEQGDCLGQPFGPKEFCDRVFSLQHNGGSYLNKVSWKTGTGYGLTTVLNAHAESDWKALAGFGTDWARRGYKIAIEKQPFPNDFRWSYCLDEYTIDHGDPVQSPEPAYGGGGCSYDCDICYPNGAPKVIAESDDWLEDNEAF